jgi:hypothetical protein
LGPINLGARRSPVGRAKERRMTEIGLFIAGGFVTLIAFIGILIYGYMSFHEWSKNDEQEND